MSDSKDREYAALVGIDWADEQHRFCLWDQEGRRMETGKLTHEPAELNGWVQRLRERFGGAAVAVAVEQHRGGLFHSLMQHEFLVLYPIAAATSARFRSSWKPGGSKADPTDAELLLEILQFHRHRLRPWRAHDEQTRRLGMLCEHRRKAVDERKELSNRLRAALKAYFPLALELIGENLSGPMALNFLAQWPEFDLLKKARPATLRAFFYRHNSRSARRVEERIEKVRSAEALSEDELIIEIYRLQVEKLTEQLRILNKHIQRYQRRIAELFEAHPEAELFGALPAAGPALAPRLVALFGTDRDRFDSAETLQNLTGISPITESSGKRNFVHRRWGGPNFLGQGVHEFAHHSVHHSLWAKAYYQRARARGMGHHAAVRALAYKWLRILFRCWKDRKPYEEIRYLQTLQKRGSLTWKALCTTPQNPTTACS
jgi:transposase